MNLSRIPGNWLLLARNLIGSFLFASHAVAGDYHECVGRYELSIPGIVDVATTTPAVFSGKSIKYAIQFPDGQPTMYSSFGFNGEFQIFHDVSPDLSQALLREKMEFVGANGNKFIENRKFVSPWGGKSSIFALSGDRVAEFNLYNDGEFIIFKAISYVDEQATVEKRAIDTLANLRNRKQYEIPTGAGVCLPGIFIVSKGTDDFSNIGVTFRLKQHPDVTIFFADRTAGDLSKMSSQQRNEFVWTSDAIGKVVHLHGPMRYRPTMMAGRPGTASFATVTRYDGATDYAYLVTVQGDPNASVDTPDLELLVERTAKYAAKGVPPVSGDQLEDIAKAIAESVTRRPTQ